MILNLSDYFDPVSIEKSDFSFLAGPALLSHNITINTENKPITTIDHFAIALIGVTDDRNSPNKGASLGADAVRQRLYRLARIPGKMKIADLGNLKSGVSFPDTLAGLSDVVSMLIDKGVFPVIIGGTSALTPSLDRSLTMMGQGYNLLTVDSRLDFHPETKEITATSYLNNILYNSRSSCKGFSAIGYQTYLNDPQVINRFRRRGYELLRVGDVRSAFPETEPSFRDAGIVVFDISAVRQSDAPGTVGASPNGFYGEEICLLARYAGLSDNLRIFSITEVNPTLDNRGQTAELAAQVTWFFLEAFTQKQFETPVISKKGEGRFIRYHVKLTDMDQDLIFVRSTLTDRWWMELTTDDGKIYTACSNDDYMRANRDEIPERWFRASSRLKKRD